MVFMVKLWWIFERGVLRVGPWWLDMPALAIIVSMVVMEWIDWRVAMAAWMDVSEELSRGRIMSLLFGLLVWREESVREVGEVGSRTQAIIVVLGRRRRASTRARPSPGLNVRRLGFVWLEGYVG